MNREKIMSHACELTVLDDGEVRYPVVTLELVAWRDANGPITASNYERFCSDVDYMGRELGTPGNAAIIELCSDLIESGAALERLPA